MLSFSAVATLALAMMGDEASEPDLLDLLEERKYKMDWLDSDLEDEGFFAIFPIQPSAHQPKYATQSHNYNPGWDFEPAYPMDSVSLVALAAVEEVAPVARSLGLGPIYVFFADLSEDNHVMRYVNGTSSAPFLAMDGEVFLSATDMYTEIRRSLLHELGRAFLDSAGIDTQDQTEADAVEHFAQTGDVGALRRYGN